MHELYDNKDTCEVDPKTGENVYNYYANEKAQGYKTYLHVLVAFNIVVQLIQSMNDFKLFTI